MLTRRAYPLHTLGRTARWVAGVLLLVSAWLCAGSANILLGGDYDYTTNNGAITITKYTGPGGSVVIPSTINDLPVTSIGEQAFEDCYNLILMTIPGGVTNIGVYAFGYCRNLASVSIPPTVLTLGAAAFYDCSALTNVTIPPYVTSIENMTFSGCKRLCNIAIPHGVTNIGDNAFSDCASLSAVMIPESVVTMGQEVFSDCGSLIRVEIPASVTNIKSALFSGCVNLDAVEVHPGNAAYCSVDGMLMNKAQTVLLECPGGKTGHCSIPATITNIASYAFADCEGLTAVTIPNSVLSIGMSVFANCRNLAGISLPASVVSISYSAFSGCASLESITVDPANLSFSSLDGVLFNKSQTMLKKYPEGKRGDYVIPDSVTKMEGGSFYRANLSSVTIPGSVHTIGDSMFTSCANLGSVSMAQGVTLIGRGAFQLCVNLTNVAIPEGVVGIQSFAFGACYNLAGVRLPDSVTNIEAGAFSNCRQLDEIEIPKRVTGIGYLAFSGCGRLESITVDPLNPAYSSLDGVLMNKAQTMLIKCPDAKTGNLAIPGSVTGITNDAFTGCANLESMTVDPLNPLFSSKDGVLLDKAQTTLIQFPKGREGDYAVPSGVFNIEKGAFMDCRKLVRVTLPHSSTNMGTSVFTGCTNLQAITVDPHNPAYSSLDGLLLNKAQTRLVHCPAGKSGSVTIPGTILSIESDQFSGCARLTSVTISDGVTNIADRAFSNCASLTNITLSGSIVSIGDMAFKDCSALTAIMIPPGIMHLGNAVFAGCERLQSITVDSLNPSYCSLEGFVLDKSQTILLCCPPGLSGTCTIPGSVVRIEDNSFLGCHRLTSITMGGRVMSMGEDAFLQCANLRTVYFPGNAPSANPDAFGECPLATVHYLPGTTGWRATFCGRPTAVWLPCIEIGDIGMKTNHFGFGIRWASGRAIIVDACTNLAKLAWIPIETNTLAEHSYYFSDSASTNAPARFYRLRMP